MNFQEQSIKRIGKELSQIDADINLIAQATNIASIAPDDMGVLDLRSKLVWLQCDPKNASPTPLILDHHHENFEILHKIKDAMSTSTIEAMDQIKYLENPRTDQHKAALVKMQKLGLPDFLLKIRPIDVANMALEDLQSALSQLKKRFELD